MTNCSIDNCAGSAFAFGLCEKHYMRDYYKKHRDKFLARANAAYARDPENGKARAKAWREKNPERKKQNDAAWVKANPERHNAHGRAWALLHKEEIALRAAKKRKERNDEYKARDAKQREIHREEYRASLREWKKRNQEKVYADGARRRAKKIGQTPKWANEFFISEAYHLARLRTKMTGIKWHVDHIVPLRSRIVCGLHWEKNLAVIPAVVNQSKNNRYWPDMP